MLFGIINGTNMKIAISIDDELLQQADETARHLGLSRSRFFATAVRDFLHRQQQEQMLMRLNEVYGNHPEPDEKRLLKAMKTKVARTLKDRW